MVSIPYALSVSHFINTVGADAGFAAIIGLALLVLLFFAQMRETSHLRDQVADATDHVSHLEHQIAQLSRGGGAVAGSPAAPGVAPRPASVPATGAQPAVAAAGPAASRAVAPAAARAGTAAPIAPAGVGAPALASATRLIPAFDEGPISVRQTGAAAVTGRAAAGAGAGTIASAQGPGGRDAAVMDPPGPPPATPAGGANGSTTGRASAPPAGAAGGAPGAPQPGRAPVPGDSRRAPAAAPPRTDYGSEPRSRLRGLFVALIALGVVAAIVVVLLLLTGGSSSPSPGSNSTAKVSNAPTSHRTHPEAIKPSSVNVVVLNGTSTPNLAHDVTQKLQGDGSKHGKPATATDQTHTATVVAYLPGHRAAAQIVAKSLGLGAGVVVAADQSSQAVACAQGAACSAQVIVTVGADLNSAASSSTTPTPAAGTGTAAGTSTG